MGSLFDGDSFLDVFLSLSGKKHPNIGELYPKR